MRLNALQIRSFQPETTPYKKTDERGLYLEVFPNGELTYNLCSDCLAEAEDEEDDEEDATTLTFEINLDEFDLDPNPDYPRR